MAKGEGIATVPSPLAALLAAHVFFMRPRQIIKRRRVAGLILALRRRRNVKLSQDAEKSILV